MKYLFNLSVILILSYEFLKIFYLIDNANWGVYDWDLSALHFINGFILKNDVSNFLIYFKDICSGIYANQFLPNFFFIPGYLSYFFSVDLCFLITVIFIKTLSFYGSYKYFQYLKLKDTTAIFISLIWINAGWISARYSMGHIAFFAYLLFPYLSYLFFKKEKLNLLILSLLLTQISSFGLIYLQLYFLIFILFNFFLIHQFKINIFMHYLLKMTIVQIPSILILLPIAFGIFFGINEVRQQNILFFNHYIYNTGFNLFEFLISLNFLNFDDQHFLIKIFNSSDEQVGAIGWLERYNYLGPIFIFFAFISKKIAIKEKKLLFLIFCSFFFSN